MTNPLDDPSEVSTVATGPNPFCSGRFDAIETDILIDTGAGQSVISHGLFKRLRKHVVSDLRRGHRRIVGASGIPLDYVAEANIKFKIEFRTFEQKFWIIKGLTKDVILGSDFLKNHHAQIDFYHQTVRFGRNTFKMTNTQEEGQEIHLLQTPRKVTLAPNCVTVFNCKASPDTPEGTYLARFLDNTLGLQNQPGVSIANTIIIVPPSCYVSLLAVNETNAKRVIPTRVTVAVAEVLEPNQIEEKSPDSNPADSTHGPSPATSNNDPLDKDPLPSDYERTLENLETTDPGQTKYLRKFEQNSNSDAGEENPPCTVKARVSPETNRGFQKVLRQLKHIFAESDLELGATSRVKCTLDTGNARPIRQRPYRIPFLQRPVVEEHITKMLEAKVIRPSVSPWSSPIVVVPKRDGTKRFCVDFRKVNEVTVPNSYPLPQIDEILASLGGAKYFSKMDLKSGYWQIEMEETSRPKTAFITPMGLFEFNKMPFGLATAPSIFQDLMNNTLQGMLFEFCLCYLDDIIVYSNSEEEHLKHLEAIFRRLDEAGLKLKLSKCEFFMKRLQFLGHLVSRDGIQPDFEKVRAIAKMPPLLALRTSEPL